MGTSAGGVISAGHRGCRLRRSHASAVASRWWYAVRDGEYRGPGAQRSGSSWGSHSERSASEHLVPVSDVGADALGGRGRRDTVQLMPVQVLSARVALAAAFVGAFELAIGRGTATSSATLGRLLVGLGHDVCFNHGQHHWVPYHGGCIDICGMSIPGTSNHVGSATGVVVAGKRARCVAKAQAQGFPGSAENQWGRLKVEAEAR